MLTLAGLASAWTLLAPMFLMGLGAALDAPAWQAIIPALVERQELPSAVALNAVSLQTAAPAWVRARALGIYLLVFQGLMATGSFAWGALAQQFGNAVALPLPHRRWSWDWWRRGAGRCTQSNSSTCRPPHI